MEFIQQHFDAIVALTVVALVFAVLQLKRGAPSDILFLGGLVAVTLLGVITPKQALEGFSSSAVLTVAALLVVAAGLRAAGVLDWVGHQLLGQVRTERGALWRLAMTLLSTSAFLLNTALVAMMMPVVLDWCRKRNIAPSRLLIPLSYLAILGGVCTLIGTSTTLIVNGMLQAEHENMERNLGDGRYADTQIEKAEAFLPSISRMSLFEIGQVGLPCALVGGGFMLLVAPRLLPRRTDMLEQLDEQRREYLLEMLVQPECRLIGQTVEAAGLRQLPGLFLIEIDRGGEVITPVTPSDIIYAGDRLVFTGVVSTILDLNKIPGLVPAADSTYEQHPRQQQQRHLTEVVLSRSSPLIGSTVKEGNFRQRYNAAVVAVHRNGARVTNKVGNIRLEPGDTLLLQTRTEFASTYRNHRDFYLVSSVEGSQPIRHDRAPVAAVLGLLLIGWLTLTNFLSESWPGLANPAIAAIAVAGLMIVARCMRVAEARAAIDLQLLLTIVGALGLGRALTESGAAEGIARVMVSLTDEPYLLLILIYVLTAFFTELITNNAVAAMFLPLAIALAWQGDFNPRPFIMAISLAASLSFVTPIGYQTNLMVMGPGGYRPSDYFRVGFPLAVVVATTALLLIPRVWPF